MSLKIAEFGQTNSGKTVRSFTVSNGRGMAMTVSDLGAVLISVLVPDKNGDVCDVVLGYDQPAGYEKADPFFGAIVGRNANRIGNAAFTLNGKTYELCKNDGENNLHSGIDFFIQRIWDVKEVDDQSVTFALHSPDGDQGYPGSAEIEVTYTLTEENEIRIDYQAVPSEDTVFNMTNHSYFNLNGHASGDILDQKVWIDADSYTRADAASIPTGELTDVTGTPMDFRTKKAIGRDIEQDYEALRFGKGYDHNFVLNNHGSYAKVAEMSAKESGITMEVYTDLPGMQLYTGNFITDESGKGNAVYQKRQAACFETQYFPDAVNQEAFEGPICKGGSAYRTTTTYKFSV